MGHTNLEGTSMNYLCCLIILSISPLLQVNVGLYQEPAANKYSCIERIVDTLRSMDQIFYRGVVGDTASILDKVCFIINYNDDQKAPYWGRLSSFFEKS
jgi:hypothetical protein